MAENVGNKLFTLAAASRLFGLDLIKFDDCSRWIIARLHPPSVFCLHCTASLTEDYTFVYV
jgi:hypothetical protein